MRFKSKFSVYKNKNFLEFTEQLIATESKPSLNSHQLEGFTWPGKNFAHTKILDLGFEVLMTDKYPKYRAQIQSLFLVLETFKTGQLNKRD